MTKLEYVAQALEITLGLVLVAKLLVSRLHVIYKFFSLYLVCQLLGSSLWLLQRLLDMTGQWSDYRLLWVGHQLLVGTLVIVTVYTLLGAVLKNLPGILSLSRKVLNGSFIAAALIATLALAYESLKSGYLNQASWQDTLVAIGILADRTVSIVVLASILAILTLLLWFPIRIARNLAFFIVGFSVYAAGSSFSLLFQDFLARDSSRIVSTSLLLLTSASYACWIAFLSPAGETISAQLNLKRDPREQDRLLRTLELLNDSVLRGASR